ncbi:MAG: hypothetical protein GX173_10065, partial [Ruminococcaceae bacterium]|nr:hypothetical protein [Oscillospiraceae bacterium]
MEKRISVDHTEAALAVFGSCNGHLELIGQILDVSIDVTGEGLLIQGAEENLTKATAVCEQLLEINRQGHPINLQLVTYLADTAREGNLEQVFGYTPDCVCVTAKGRPVR